MELIEKFNALFDEFGCQCQLGNEKPTVAQIKLLNEAALEQRKVVSAPLERPKPLAVPRKCHVLIVFKSPTDPNDQYMKLFHFATSVNLVKQHLAKKLDTTSANIDLTRDGCLLKDNYPISDVRHSKFFYHELKVYLKNGEDFTFHDIQKDEYLEEVLLPQIENKKPVEYVVIKFRVKYQNTNFTCSYSPNMNIIGVKKNLSDVFKLSWQIFEMYRKDKKLEDAKRLKELDYDEFGNIDIELVMKDCVKLDINKIYKYEPIADIMSVILEGKEGSKRINVSVVDARIVKPYLGGYKDINSGTIFHHAYTQTQPKQEKVPPEDKTCRDTQTAVEKEINVDTVYSRSTQMWRDDHFIQSVTDYLIVAKPYETYEEMMKRLRLDHHASVIQRSYRAYKWRQFVKAWLIECKDIIDRMKLEEINEKEAHQKRLRKDLITKTFPRTREDFDQLYAMVDRWKEAEIARISHLYSQGPRIAEFSVLLDKEVELLRSIEAYRAQVKEDSRKIKEVKFLEEISKPVVWYARDGHSVISMFTVEAQRAQRMKQLYLDFCKDDLTMEDRLALTVDLKKALSEYNHHLTREIMSLLDREAELSIRNCSAYDLKYLRERIKSMIFRFLGDSNLNAGVTRRKDVKDYVSMLDGTLYLCEMCHKLKGYNKFTIHAKMTGVYVCTSCSWKNITSAGWVDMTPFKFILRTVQREERKRKCWGSFAFILQEKDVYFIVEKLWHSHSAVSETTNMYELRLCRWYRDKDWSPWNCFLCTMTEEKAHLKLENPDIIYDTELVRKVKNKHMLAKVHFLGLLATEKKYTESGRWHKVVAPATARIDGVAPI